MKAKLISCMCVLAVFCSSATAKKDEPIVPDKLVVLKLDGQIRETPPGIDLGLPDIKPNLFWDQLRLIRMAGDDETVKALIVLIDKPELNLAQCQQILAELKRFRKTNKQVFVHADSLSAGPYLLALGADHITVSPSAMLALTGVKLQVLYYRELMNKLGIDAEVEARGEYKLAAEPYTRPEPSPAMIQQLNELVEDVYAQIVSEIAAARKMTTDQVNTLIDQGIFLASDAVKHKLIDQVAHRSEFLLETQKSLKGRLVFDYGKSGMLKMKPGLAGLVQMFTFLGTRAGLVEGNEIAIVVISGFLTEGETEDYFGEGSVAGSSTLRRAFEQIDKDDHIKAVVVRIDSPGGSATASEIIWDAVKRTAQRKPLVVSMSGMGASGGYYIACAADHIMAVPATLTGSIGVVSGKPVLGGLLNKIGVKPFSVSKGKNANMFDLFAKYSDHERQTMHVRVTQIFENFKKRVREGRKSKLSNVDSVATGKVFTGKAAIKLGLIDEMGTLADAVEWAAKQAKLETYRVVFMPEPKTILEVILEGLGYKVDPEQIQSITPIRWHLLNQSSLPMPYAFSSALLGTRILTQAELIMRVLRRGGVLALTPLHIEVR